MTTTKVHLYSCTEHFAEHATTIRALLFGEMVRRATPIVESYQSDLFHDAAWLTTHVNGPVTFEWLVRDYGTHIGESARIAAMCAGSKTEFYQVALTVERGRWFATFTNVPLHQVASLPPLEEHQATSWFTADGVQVREGLRVFTNDCVWGTVRTVAERVEASGAWHTVELDTGSSPSYNGERIAVHDYITGTPDPRNPITDFDTVKEQL